MSTIKKLFAVVTVVTLLGGAVAPVPASALTAAEIQAQIDTLMATLAALQTQLPSATPAAPSTSAPAACSGVTFSANLTVGSSGVAVKCLQALLNQSADTQVAATGAGSPGNESMYFGPATRAAVIKFQDKYASEVLAPANLTAGTGFVGASTRAKLNMMLTGAAPITPAPVSGLPAGCTTTAGYSPTTGVKCDTVTVTPPAPVSGLPAGCTTTAGYSTTTGAKCDSTTTPAPTTGAYSVMAASSNPASGTLGASSAYNTVVAVQVSGGNTGATVSSVTVERYGLSVDTQVDGVLVVDETGKRHGNVLTLADGKVTIPFTDNPIVVPAGGSAVIRVQTHIDSTGSSGTIGFKVTEMSGTPAGLPVMGNLNTMTATTSTLGTLTVDRVTVSSGADVNVDVNQTDYVLTKFRLTAGANEAIKVSRINLFQNGTAADADLINFELLDPNGNILATVAKASDKMVDFALANPYEIGKGLVRDLTVRVDVNGGTSRTGQLVVQNDYDVQVIGASTGLGILPTAGPTTDTSFPVGDGANVNTLSVSSGTLTISKSSTSPSGTFGKGQSAITLATWDLAAQGEDIQIQRAAYEINGTSDDGDFVGTVRLTTDAGQTLHSIDAGTDELFDADGDGSDIVTLASYYTIPAGTTLKVKLVVDAAAGIDTGETAIGALGDIYYKRVVSNTYATASDGALVAGNTLSASASTLTVTNNAALGNATVIEGGSNVLIGSYLLQTSSSEGVNVSSLNIDATFAGAAAVGALSNMKLKKVDGTQIGSTIATPTASNTFTVSGQLNIAASDTVQVDVYVNMSTAASNGGTDDTITTNVDADDISGVGAISGTTVTGPSAAVTGRVITAVEGGTIAVSIDSSSAASSSFLTPGLTGVEMGRVKLASTVEDMKVQKLVLRTVNGAGNVANVKLLGTGLSSDPSTSLTAGTATFTFASGSEIMVPAYGSRVITAVVDTTPVGTLAAADLGVLGFSTADVIGAGSGLTVQESLTGTAYIAATDAYSGDVGDVLYFTATADAGTNTAPGFYMVTTDEDAVNLATGDLALNGGATATSWSTGDIVTKLTKAASDADGTIDAMAMALAVGDLIFVHDIDAVTNDGFYVVKTAVASGASAVGANTIDDVTLAAGDFITKFTNSNGLAGNSMRYEEVEPVITVTATGGASTPSVDQTVATIAIKASGYRDLTFNGISLEKLGSNSAWNVKDFKLYSGSTLLAEVSGLNASARTAVSANDTDPTDGFSVDSTLGFAPADAVLYIDVDAEANSGITTVSTVTGSTAMVLAADVFGGTATDGDLIIKYAVSDVDGAVENGIVYDVADGSRYQVGDRLYIISATDTGDNGTATVAVVGPNSITVTQTAIPGISSNPSSVANGEAARVINITRGSDTVVFNASSLVPLAEQTVTAGTTTTLTVKADTTYVKRAEDSSGNITSIAASFGLRIAGS
ncbi:MAG: peptidoglycan-binding protein, partial [Candidatus Wildermuthbacteria bacterium]|nr:peptidoglycan-binding protein [Candidatus Wildermuthbacteria bacterium]